MFNPLKQLFDFNKRQLNAYRNIVAHINELEEKARKLKDADFRKETDLLKTKLQSGKESVEGARPWAFALVREAARRTLGQRHFDEQLIAGIALSEGKISEQKTGEGKTLSATTALYLHALMGKGAHLVTVNDYLARRDAGWMGGVFALLGLTTAAMISEVSYKYDKNYSDPDTTDWRLKHLRRIDRKEAYECDITYGINSEFGFDYLRDNMVSDPSQIRQKEYYYAIIDEADSVLIDEARTPHIISAPSGQDVSRYYTYAQIVKQLDPKDHFIIDEKTRSATLTEAGVSKVESLLGVSNMYEKDFDTLFHVEAALKAQTLFKNDKDYIVRNGEVVIVDEFTGRLLEGRRFSEGIHQAIEAKENVAIQQESKTLATVSLQNYFRMYKILAGMTGTAATEAEEFHKIYKTDVVVVPTHRPQMRKDEPDMIYKTERGKYNAVVEEVARNHKVGRPVLIGTVSIEKNELVSRLLNARGIRHQVLNAKNHEQEAHIIAGAGKKYAVTVATNMAGRGVDIILGGDPDIEGKGWQKQHDEVVDLGGLLIIGTERHESRRIDNQLRGRSGRQGDPGESRFFVALEDDLMRIFGGEQISKLMTFFNLPEDQPLTHAMVNRAIESAQIKVEGHNFDTRKHLVDYDDVLNKQREIVYELRRNILLLPDKSAKEFKSYVLKTFDEEIQGLANGFQYDGSDQSIAMNKEYVKEVALTLNANPQSILKIVNDNDGQQTVEYLRSILKKLYDSKDKEFGTDQWSRIVRFLFLNTIDTFFTEHLTTIEDLRAGIGLRGYAQLDPLVQYKNEAFSLFEKLLNGIYYETLRRIVNVQKVENDAPPLQLEQPEKELVLSAPAAVSAFAPPAPPKAGPPPTAPAKAKIGRNDPCWCGSGKKYKKCHYPN